MKSDLIAAIATAPGQAGIAVVRISGKKAYDVLAKIFSHDSEYESHRLYYGAVKDGQNIIDYAMATFMEEPHTYTGENTVEIFCHGGYAVSRRVLECVLKNGCRMAEAGEFTKRAFLNGRMDLSQAEAVSDLIAANARLAYDVALNNLSGRIKKKINNMRAFLLDFLAKIEVCIDYPEDDVEEQTAEIIAPEIDKMIITIEELLKTADRGKIYKEGLICAIAGRPNVGKSSLLNAIVGESRAIVTTIPGTTRDTLHAHVDINGLEVTIIDTAGIRESQEDIEKLGIKRAEDIIKKCDIVIFVVDNELGVTDEDIKVYEKIKHKHHIVTVNKIDMGNNISENILDENFGKADRIFVSALEHTNIIELEDMIFDNVGENKLSQNEVVLSNLRHIKSVEDARRYLMDARKTLKDDMPIDLAVMDIKNAWHALGEVTGDTVDEDIVERIFSKFCVGK